MIRDVSMLLHNYAGSKKYVQMDELYHIARRHGFVRSLQDFNQLMTKYLAGRTHTKGNRPIYTELAFRPMMTNVSVDGKQIGLIRVGWVG